MNVFKSTFLSAIILLAVTTLPSFACAYNDLSSMEIDRDATYLLQMKNGRRYAGRIENVESSYLLMTRRCGRLAWPNLVDIESVKKVDDKFVPKTFDEIRLSLVKEFQGKYTVSRTKHFLVVHPPGSFEKWASPFESFYANFHAYWRARGVKLKEAEFPLVAVVLKTNKEFRNIAKFRDMESAGGFFSHDSNRLFTYVMDHGSFDEEKNHQSTFYVICHEIAHQLSFNTGLENRGFSSAQWFTEGLAQMFEAPGVNDSIKNSTLASRIHFGELKQFLKFRKDGQTKAIIKRHLNGGLFDTDKNLAYTTGWALMMFLSETRPKQLAEYAKLQRIASKRGENAWSRTELFEKAFGDVKLLEAHMNNYMDKLAEEVNLK